MTRHAKNQKNIINIKENNHSIETDSELKHEWTSKTLEGLIFLLINHIAHFKYLTIYLSITLQ